MECSLDLLPCTIIKWFSRDPITGTRARFTSESVYVSMHNMVVLKCQNYSVCIKMFNGYIFADEYFFAESLHFGS